MSPRVFSSATMRRALTIGVAAGAACAVSALPARADSGPQYVALGDSFTAGPLIPNQTGSPSLCLRSDHNYPHLLAKRLNATKFTDASCSGATTGDMYAAQNLGVESNPAQLNSVNANTTLVTVQIGGNDVGFAGIMAKCAELSVKDENGAPCKNYYTSGGTDQLAQRVDQLAPKVRKLLGDIHSRAPKAHIDVVGYLRVLPTGGSGCYPSVPIAKGDLVYLTGFENGLNGMLANAAKAADDTYVGDDETGHDACQSASVRWVEPFQFKTVAPVHPNAAGMAHVADKVVGAQG